MAIKTKTNITATVPHRTNFVKLLGIFMAIIVHVVTTSFKF